MKKFLILASLFLGCSSDYVPQPSTVKHEIITNKIAWRKLNSDTVRESTFKRKAIMLWFYRKDCEDCATMMMTTFQNPCVIQEVQQHLIPIPVDADRHSDLVETYLGDNPVYPSTQLIAPSGLKVHPLIEGNVPTDPFCASLKSANQDLDKALRRGKKSSGN